MKKFLFGFGLIATLAAAVNFDKSANAETFGCQANPKIGATCTERVTIQLRKVQSEGRDEFDRRYEPDSGWVIQDYDCRDGVRVRTGESSGPNCVKVQAGSITTSSSYVQAQANRVYETIQKAKAQGGNAAVQASAEMENRARSEFSNLDKTASVHQSNNYGLQINAWVAVEGGCRGRVPLTGDCYNWGPGGTLNTDIIVHLVYVGTNQDIDQIAAKYIAEANRIAKAASESDAAALERKKKLWEVGSDYTEATIADPSEGKAFQAFYSRCGANFQGKEGRENFWLVYWHGFHSQWKQDGVGFIGCGVG